MSKSGSTNIVGNRIEVLIIKDSFLEAERWDFAYFDGKNELRFVKWVELKKETSRHKYKTVKIWDWYDRRSYRPLDTPPAPSSEIVELARDAWINKIVSEMKINLDTSR